MGSSGFGSPFGNNIFEPSINPKVELGCNMIESFNQIGEAVEDLYKDQREGTECLRCRKHFYPRKFDEYYCISCQNDNSNKKNYSINNYGAKQNFQCSLCEDLRRKGFSGKCYICIASDECKKKFGL